MKEREFASVLAVPAGFMQLLIDLCDQITFTAADRSEQTLCQFSVVESSTLVRNQEFFALGALQHAQQAIAPS